MEHGDVEARVVQFCEITHLRAFAAIGDVPGHRRDATCCLGRGGLARQPDAERHLGGCGSCGHGGSPDPGLIRLERRRTPPTSRA
jgi:hypothetical protein